MLTVRKGRIGEEEQILDVANRAFRPVRYQTYDFKNSIPKMYNNNLNFSLEHHVVLDGDKMVAIAGNPIRKIKVDSKEYKYALLGTVATLPEYSGKGAMKLIMKNINEQDLNDNVVFSVLSGARKRYNYYGYEQGGQRYKFEFTKYFAKHYEFKEIVDFKLYDNRMLDECYEIYEKYQPVVAREKIDFEVSLKEKDNKIYCVFNENKLIGYFALSLNMKTILEVTLIEPKFIGAVIKKIMIDNDLDSLIVGLNPLYYDMFKEIDKISDERMLYDYMNIKVYNMQNFLEMLLGLNLKSRPFPNLIETYKIDKQIYKIRIKNKMYEISVVDEPYIKEFTAKEFIRYSMGFQNMYEHKSNLFPLLFDINAADDF